MVTSPSNFEKKSTSGAKICKWVKLNSIIYCLSLDSIKKMVTSSSFFCQLINIMVVWYSWTCVKIIS